MAASAASAAGRGQSGDRRNSAGGRRPAEGRAVPPGRARAVPGGGRRCTTAPGSNNRAGALGARYRDWAERLAKAGFVVLLPDSNGSRGLGSQCGARRRACASIASGSPTPTRRAPGCRSRTGSPPTGCRCSAGRAAAISRAVGGAGARSRPSDGGRTSARRSRSIRAAGGSSNAAWSARVPTLILIGRADDRPRPRLPADGGGRARPQRAGGDPGLSRRAPRLRPSEPAAAGAHRARLLGRRHRPRPQRHQSGRARRRAQARAGVSGSGSVSTDRTRRRRGSASRCRRAISSAGR